MSTIGDLEVIPLRRIPDKRDAVLHKLRDDDPYLSSFGVAGGTAV